jgi:hypothetical protein
MRPRAWNAGYGARRPGRVARSRCKPETADGDPCIEDPDASPGQGSPGRWPPRCELVATLVAHAGELRPRDSGVSEMPARVRTLVLDSEQPATGPHDEHLDPVDLTNHPALLQEPVRGSRVHRTLPGRPSFRHAIAAFSRAASGPTRIAIGTPAPYPPPAPRQTACRRRLVAHDPILAMARERCHAPRPSSARLMPPAGGRWRRRPSAQDVIAQTPANGSSQHRAP